MINFELTEPKNWKMTYNDLTLEIPLISSTVTNKFHIITTYTEDISKEIGEEFDEWFFQFLSVYQKEKDRGKWVVDNLSKLMNFIDIYMEKVNIDYSQFVDMSKVNPAFKVGLVEEINPNARFFKDLTKEQKEVYKRNVLDQTKLNLV